MTTDFAFDMNLSRTPTALKTRGKVSVIGSGPAGLTVAGDLSKMEFSVTVFDALQENYSVCVKHRRTHKEKPRSLKDRGSSIVIPRGQIIQRQLSNASAFGRSVQWEQCFIYRWVIGEGMFGAV